MHLCLSLLPPSSSGPPSFPQQTSVAAPNCSSCLLAPLIPFQGPDGRVISSKCKSTSCHPLGGWPQSPPWPVCCPVTSHPSPLLSPLLSPLQCEAFRQAPGCPAPSHLGALLSVLTPCTTPYLVNPSSSFSLGTTAQASSVPVIVSHKTVYLS